MTAEPTLTEAGRLCAIAGKALGARRALLVAASCDDVLEALHLPADTILAEPLGGVPVTCTDLRELGTQARQQGVALVIANELTGLVGCASNRLGAHVALVPLEDGLSLVGFSRDCACVLPHAVEALAPLATESEADAARASQALDEAARVWHAASDAAQVVASYLRCHPKVTEVRYPGLKTDPSFSIAARTLQGGFGPLVDYRTTEGATWVREYCTCEDARSQVLMLEHRLAHE